MLVDYKGLKVTEEKAELLKQLRIKHILEIKNDFGYIPWPWDGCEYYGLAFVNQDHPNFVIKQYTAWYLVNVSCEELRNKIEYLAD
ncbi:hypothetical protein U5N54_02485 [Bacillus paralicheniformis]|uniref:hypothetical protein n=1 Tax=Bacillus TaxID=1386 RepID=UPI0003A8B538|nr:MULTISPECIES: hypothetical protein [Bacillus]MBW7636461.1 hypothetical protein [Bacillus licheniformis]MDE1424939.1 hypothetical protein [Bacillus licheniformis]MEC5225249.1 hypothetical protein [Bacillus licheniformis]MED5050136.1 hypothetical protein [Bacillus siamensis]TWK52325.1 hypothetical protein CHCC20347_1978 [Bacillus paralicheniformis]